jgi:hypothetical protein
MLIFLLQSQNGKKLKESDNRPTLDHAQPPSWVCSAQVRTDQSRDFLFLYRCQLSQHHKNVREFKFNYFPPIP